MKLTFQKSFNQLNALANRFEKPEIKSKLDLLGELSKQKLPEYAALVSYHNLLLFLCSHPSNASELLLAEKELQRIANFLKQNKRGLQGKYAGSGLPFTQFVGAFSHDIITWAFTQKNIQTKLDSFSNEGLDINKVLGLTLPNIEKNICDLELSDQELFSELGIEKNTQLNFLVEQLNKFNDRPLLKDYLFDSLQAFIEIGAKHQSFSKSYNRFIKKPIYFHKDLIRKFDSRKLIDTKLPGHKKLDEKAKEELIATIKNSLLLMGRETDPSTYLDANSLRLYELERGISVAIYGMVAKRQLPSESYVGYTLFKNGFPTAYGGAWVFGKRALFGINIFEAFRGGESGYILSQLLRVYKQAFSLSYFEVEPYQFGKDNSEGISSGAFWFYYRYGFRPVDKTLYKLAENETKKIAAKKEYRSSKTTLIKFTDSNVCLNFEKRTPPSPTFISEKVRAHINKVYKGNRIVAEKECVRIFIEKVGGMASMSTDEYAALKEIAFTSAALKVHSIKQLNILKLMVRAKANDVYKYQELLLEFLEGE